MNYEKKKKGYTKLKEITSHPLVAGVLVVIVLSIMSTIKDKYLDKPSNNQASIEKIQKDMSDLKLLVTDLGDRLGDLTENYKLSLVSINESIKERDEKIGKNKDDITTMDKRLSIIEVLWNGK